ncbi:DUF4767 domain-containing protein [Lactiplantibacillus modestisalitolerans]|uniref:DUF4767 domain-containing protein n=1 Tax=Lactiplantibacillus modestisalitolerans TaxID=1457219 RepID=A0ABV5WV09_9LACO|nr:DUF4767 domain-containing protein [Lactiplantibacillus modestisalitolerans]
MRKISFGLLAVAVLLTGCGQSQQSQSKAASSTSSQVKHQKLSTADSTSETKRAAKTSSSTAADSTWNQTKRARLADFMEQWQAEMGQTYVGTYQGKQPDHLGYKFPAALTNGDLDGRVEWGHQKVTLTWAPKADQDAAIQVLAVATGGKPETPFPTTYFFCLHNQRPVVLMTQTTNGETLYVQDTQNGELQAGFAKIVTGEKPAIKSDSSLMRDVNAAVKTQPQRWPQGFGGTWYYYSPYDHRVEAQRWRNVSDWKLNSIQKDGQQWLHIVGAHQTAGAGTFEALRYRYYDGQQVPVMLSASGAGVWFDNNLYPTRAMAEQMQDWNYGDEPDSAEADID